MLTPVERVLVLKGADLLKDVGPRHLLGLANVAREIEIFAGDRIYEEKDPADALYIVVEGRVVLLVGDRKISEVGPGEAFGTWSLVDDSERGHRAECAEDGLTLALHRDEFYEIASGDLALLQELVRVLAKRLRSLVDKPEDARVEGEGVEKPEAVVEAESAPPEAATPVPSAGETLEAAALGKPLKEPATTDLSSERMPPPDETVSTPMIESPGTLEGRPAPSTGTAKTPDAGDQAS